MRVTSEDLSVSPTLSSFVWQLSFSSDYEELTGQIVRAEIKLGISWNIFEKCLSQSFVILHLPLPVI